MIASQAIPGELEGLVPYAPNIIVSIKYRCLGSLCFRIAKLQNFRGPHKSEGSF